MVAFAADLGQGEELAEVAAKAKATGADEVFIEDLKEEFVRDFVWPMFRANALYEGAYLLGTSIARPLIAKAQVEVALRVGADAVSHGATGKGNDQVRFELTYMALAPDLKIIAPWREWDLAGRAECVAYAQAHGIPVPVTKAKPYSSDRNLLQYQLRGRHPGRPLGRAAGGHVHLTKSRRRPRISPCTWKSTSSTATRWQWTALASARRLLARLNDLGGEHGIDRVGPGRKTATWAQIPGVYGPPAAPSSGRRIWPWNP